MQVKQTYLKNENNEVISPVTSVNSVYGENGQNLLDLFYPVGSYYETSNSNFNPNKSWGGTWVQDTKGYVTVGATNPDESQGSNNNKLILNVNNTTGEVKHTLSINEMPSHNHRLQMRIAGSGDQEIEDWGAPSVIQTNMGYVYALATGGSQAHNNVQPSIGVYRWHRTA